MTPPLVAPGAFRRELTPRWVSAMALLAGYEPLDTGRALQIVDLRARRGVTAAVVAATSPDACVWAYDPDPTNLEQAELLARSAGLDNLIVRELGTGSLGSSELPSAVDLVIADDLVTTISPQALDSVVAFVRSHTRPGGLVALRYRTLSGWADLLPIRRLLELLLPREADDDGLAVARGLLSELAAGGARYFEKRPQLEIVLRLGDAMSSREAAEWLVPDELAPMSPAHLVREFANAGCRFIGSLTPADPIDGVNDELREQLADVTELALRETLRDIVEQPLMRAVLLRRGGDPGSDAVRQERLRELELARLGGDHDRTPGGEIDRVVCSAWGLLATAPRRVEELEQLTASVATVSPEDLVHALLGRGLAHPVVRPREVAVDACRRLTQALLGRSPAEALVVAASAGTAFPRTCRASESQPLRAEEIQQDWLRKLLEMSPSAPVVAP